MPLMGTVLPLVASLTEQHQVLRHMLAIAATHLAEGDVVELCPRAVAILTPPMITLHDVPTCEQRDSVGATGPVGFARLLVDEGDISLRFLALTRRLLPLAEWFLAAQHKRLPPPPTSRGKLNLPLDMLPIQLAFG